MDIQDVGGHLAQSCCCIWLWGRGTCFSFGNVLVLGKQDMDTAE
jgi:hypothetical protein